MFSETSEQIQWFGSSTNMDMHNLMLGNMELLYVPDCKTVSS